MRGRGRRWAVAVVLGLATAAAQGQTGETGVSDLRIYEIQGEGHRSAFDGTAVTTSGVVTALRSNGFYLQDPTGDGNTRTSDGIFVFTGGRPTVAVGDALEVAGTVSEFTPGGVATGNLSITQITGPAITVISSGNPLPRAKVIGENGRPVPSVIDDDGLTSYDPDSDAIDFFESLEGMRVRVEQAIAVQPTSGFGEIAVLADRGAGVDQRTDAGGVFISAADLNAERIILDDEVARFSTTDAILPPPAVNVGDRFIGPITGVIDYSFGAFKLQYTEPLPEARSGPAVRETSSLTGSLTQLTVATYNVLNLDPSDGDGNPATDDQISRVARDIVSRLNGPDIVALQEIQDDSGSSDNGTTAATLILTRLTAEIAAIGGPAYRFFDIAPVNNADGGAPGSNIRVAYLYNPDRVGFERVGAAGPLDEVAVVDGPDGPVLSLNPGRVEAQSPAFEENPALDFEGTRKPLAAQFTFNGETVFVVNVHFKSKTGDDPLFGEEQPAFQNTLDQRVYQAELVNEFVEAILAKDPNAKIIVLGDTNDFDFSETLAALKGDDLENLLDRIPVEDRYTFNFEGNSQVLDNVLVSRSLSAGAEIDIVHSNVDVGPDEWSSDHDPVLARFEFGSPIDATFLGRTVPAGGEPVEGGAEIVAADSRVPRLYVTNGDRNGVDVFLIEDPTAPRLLFELATPDLGGDYAITSVTVGRFGVAALFEDAEDAGGAGKVVITDRRGNLIDIADVGAGADSIALTPDGRTLVVANEGERGEDADGNPVDPPGSISLVRVNGGGRVLDVATIDFSEFDGQEAALRAEGVRITAGLSASIDFEPEFVAIAGDGQTAAVTLQENNAIVFIDIATGEVTGIAGLGAKDHSVAGNGLDASDRDDAINIASWPVFGLYQPDGIASFEVGGETFWVIANEGDTRDGEVERLADAIEDGLVTLDPTVFPDVAALIDDAALGRLEIFINEGDTDGDGDLDALFVPGARSFSVLDADGDLIFDSGDDFEQITADLLPLYFNSTNDDNDSFDNRSDNKGPEPEGVVTGVIDGIPFAFVGLERIGGVMMYDLSDPASPEFVRYITSRDFTAEVGTLAAGDLAPEGLAFIPAAGSPTGAPLLAVANEVSGTTAIYQIDLPDTFRLQLLHASDLEGGVDAIGRAPNFAAIMDALEDLEANSITLSAGDNLIPGPFFNAAGDPSLGPVLTGVYNDLFGLPADVNGDGVLDSYADIRAGEGRADITIMNIIGFDASALGNHEFDAGTNFLGGLLRPDFQGPGLANDRWVGAQFPYLSSNLDFSLDSNLSGSFTSAILPNTSFATGPAQSLANQAQPKIAPATTIEVGGETIGVVGATTQLLATISSPGATTVIGPDANDMPALAAILQPVIDQLMAQGLDKIILVSHLQQIALETELAGLLDGVDIIVAGGSDTILANDDDELRPGDEPAGAYPRVVESATGAPVAIVSTDGEYSYVGRLVVEFNYKGEIIPESIDPALNGPIATTDEAVETLWGSLDAAFADGTKGELVERVVDAVGNIVAAQDGNILGETEVFLEGRRTAVRTEETNFGNLSADANLWYAREVDPTVVASIKNGGGIRFQIGDIDSEGNLLPPAANPDVGKEEGDISQLDVVNTLRFNNGLTLLTLSTEDLLAVVEHAVRASAPGVTPGQFAQVGGLAFSWDPTAPAGDRVQSLALVNDDGSLRQALVDDSAVLASAAGLEWRIVTLNFLAGGGDGYPFPALGTGRVDLLDPASFTGDATFAPDGSEQDALAEFLLEFHGPGDGTPFAEADTPVELDERIQNLAFREDTIDDLFI